MKCGQTHQVSYDRFVVKEKDNPTKTSSRLKKRCKTLAAVNF